MSTPDLYRLEIHKKYAASDITSWFREAIQPQQGERLLDIGCGDGQQSLAMAANIGPRGYVKGIDGSKIAVGQFRKQIEARRLKNVVAEVGDMDELDLLIEGELPFDIIMSNFALYYSKNIAKVMAVSKKKLTGRGRLFLSGPALHNNYELIELHCSVTGQKMDSLLPRRMEGDVLESARAIFPRVETRLFRNPVTFTSASDLLKYWRSYYLYNPPFDEEFSKRVKAAFKKRRGFTTVKEVLGITARP